MTRGLKKKEKGIQQTESIQFFCDMYRHACIQDETRLARGQTGRRFSFTVIPCIEMGHVSLQNLHANRGIDRSTPHYCNTYTKPVNNLTRRKAGRYILGDRL